jgi:hypothetical protein
MNKVIYFLPLLLISLFANSQAISNRASSAITVQDARLFAQYNFRPPVYYDTTEANTQLGLDSAGTLVFTRSNNSYWLRSFNPKKWVLVGTGSGGGTVTAGLNAFGNFYDTTLQEIEDTDTSYVIRIGNKDTAKGITLYNNKIIVDSAGYYNIQWTAQLENVSNAYEDIYAYIWIAKNGIIVPQSTRISSAPAKHSVIDENPGLNISSSNYIVNLKSRDTIQFFWVATDPAVRLNSFKNLVYPNRPIVPSFSVNISPVIGSGGGGTVTRAVDTIYRTLSKDSIQFTINGKYYAIKDSVGGGSSNAIDSIRRRPGSDSVYGRINGVFKFQFKDSVGGGSSADTTNKFVNNIEKVNDSTLRFYKGSSNTNLVLSNGRFKNDIYIKGAATTRLGRYSGTGTNDSTRVPVAGLDLDAAFKVICQDTVHPNYTRPTTSMSSNVAAGIYDIGRTLNITFSYTPVSNDADTSYGNLLRLNNVFTANNPYSLNLSTTSQQLFDGFSQFRKTPASKFKLNNFGVFDSTNAIKSDTTVKAPNTFAYTGNYRKYWGYTTQYNPPADSVKLTSGGSNEFSTTNTKSSFNINAPNELRYIYYAYPTAFTPDITSIKINGNESINTFHKNIITINNGYINIQFAVWTSNNQVSGTIPNIVITNQ